MPDPDRLLRTIRQAAKAFCETPGRMGRLVYIGSGQEVLVAGDVHGNLENFRRLLNVAQLSTNPRRHIVLQELVHGRFHYPQGGDKSHQLLDLLSALKCQYPERVHLLLGNHEIAQWKNQTIVKSDVELTSAFREGVQSAYGPRATEIYQAYQDMLGAVPLAIRTHNRVLLSHSAPEMSQLAAFDPEILEREVLEESEWRLGGSAHSLVWGRDTSEETILMFLKRMDADFLITGHTPALEGFAFPNPYQLILDCSGPDPAYCLFNTSEPATSEGLKQAVKRL
jgi:hypothetical protein